MEGLKAYARVTDVLDPIDQATLYVPPEIGINILEDLRQKGIRKVYVNPGAGSPELMERAVTLGLEAIEAFSIIAVGSHPNDL